LTYDVVPDITKPEAYNTSFDGITGVIHVASPFNFHPEDIAKDLLEPARAGAVAILEAALQYGQSVRRVVAISSFAAVKDISKGMRPGYVYSEKDWNPMSWDEATKADPVTAYCASKAIAEHAMWEWMEAHKDTVKFSLTTLSPPWVFGPYAGPVDPNHLSESVKLLWDLIGAASVPPTDFAGFIDVRDLSQAIVKAYEKPDAAGQRFLLGSKVSYQMAVDVIRKEFPQVRDKVPEGSPGHGEVEDTYRLDTSKARKTLGLEFTPVNVTVKDLIAQILEAS
jgi:nucleoside-diphosphate-sugar epimerase